MRLAFSTLACPEWKWEQAVSAAESLGYQGIEWRMIDGALVSASFPRDACQQIKSRMKERGLESCALDASIQLALPPGEERARIIAEAHGMLELADALGTRMLRVFIGKYPPDTDDATAIRWVSEGIEQFLPRARELGVDIALEVHSFEGRGKNVNGTSDSSMCRQVVAAAGSRGIGILWDVGNPYEEGETCEETWANVKGSLLYLHVKDSKRLPDGRWEYVLNGEGQIPIGRIVGLLKSSGFDGWLSYEWEKKWHPELAGPEIALPHYIRHMRGLADFS
jgi:sugar phosphate isomerase/epimerase